MSRRTFSIALLCLAVCRCATLDFPDAEPRWPTCDARARSQTITIVHVNDLHAQYAPRENGVSPYARIRGYVNRVQTGNPFTVFTSGGDEHQKGSIAEMRTDGYATLEATHAMRFDARVMGNHDFAWGPPHTLAASHDPHGAVLASNTEYRGQTPEAWGAVRFAKRQVGCVRIGFFGFAPRPYNERFQVEDGPYFPGNARFAHRYDFPRLAREIVAAHRDEVDLMILLNHLGVHADRTLAETVEGIDLILGGHSHTLLREPLKVNGVPIVQAGAFANQLARVELDVELASGTVTAIRHRVVALEEIVAPPDPRVASTIRRIMQRHAPDARQAIAFVSAAVAKERIAKITALAAREALNVDAALVLRRSVRLDWEPGGITPQMLYHTFNSGRKPYGTPGWSAFYTVSVNGATLQHIRQALSPETWRYSGLPEPEKSGTYRIALQKVPAWLPGEYLGEGVTFDEPRFAAEAWEVLERWAHRRHEQCRYLDAEGEVPGCR